jgi:chorismate--pyruvate lyase
MQKLDWQHYQSFPRTDLPSAELMEWLLDPGSFIQRLKQYHIAEPQVHVLLQEWESLPTDERALLAVPESESGLVREVLIDSEEGQWMFARTVFPAATLTGKERELAHLQNRSLGSVLFQDPSVVRGDFDLVGILPETEWHQKIHAVAKVNRDVLWARRSLFYIQNKPLLLAEVFLPAIQTLSR